MVRYKNRYIAVKVDPVGVPERTHFKLNSTALYNAVQDKVQQLHGDFGLAAIKIGLSAKYCNEMTRVAFIRVRHGPHKFVTSALPFIKDVARDKVVIHTLYCGATMLQCHRFLKKYQRIELEKMWVQMKPADRLKLEEQITSFANLDFKNKARKK